MGTTAVCRDVPSARAPPKAACPCQAAFLHRSLSSCVNPFNWLECTKSVGLRFGFPVRSRGRADLPEHWKRGLGRQTTAKARILCRFCLLGILSTGSTAVPFSLSHERKSGGARPPLPALLLCSGLPFLTLLFLLFHIQSVPRLVFVKTLVLF